MAIESVALIGLGAMGVFFAPPLEKVLGAENFCVIAEGARKQRLTEQGVTINHVQHKFHIVEPKDGKPVDLVIMAVKYMQLDEAIKDIAAFVGEHTQILCVMNGVDSEERLIHAYGAQHVIYSYMRISIVMKNGVANFNPTAGGVHFGEIDNRELSDRVAAVQALFDRAELTYWIDDNMLRGIWYKFMCNIGENMTCALLGIPFGAFHCSEHANAVRRQAMREVLAIAIKKGIDLSEQDIEAQEATIPKLPFANKPSTLQDLEQQKKTEIDMFAGRVLALGEETGVATPMAFMFYHGIKVLEEKNSGLFDSH